MINQQEFVGINTKLWENYKKIKKNLEKIQKKVHGKIHQNFTSSKLDQMSQIIDVHLQLEPKLEAVASSRPQVRQRYSRFVDATLHDLTLLKCLVP